MRHSSWIAAILPAAVAIATMLTQQGVAADPAKVKKVVTPEFYVVSYAVTDLPVWRGTGKDAEFAPELLMSFVRLSVDPGSWELGAEMRPMKVKNQPVIVVSQTEANHERIADMFEAYRKDKSKREKAARDKKRATPATNKGERGKN